MVTVDTEMQLGLYFGTTAVVPMDLQTNDYLRPALMIRMVRLDTSAVP